MPSTDPIADFFTSLRNAAAVKKLSVLVPHSRIKEEIAKVLQREGFLSAIAIEGDKPKQLLHLTLRASAEGVPALKSITRMSVPGQRWYTSYRDLRRVRQGLGLSLLSTPDGILTDTEARKKRVGGELLAHVW